MISLIHIDLFITYRNETIGECTFFGFVKGEDWSQRYHIAVDKAYKTALKRYGELFTFIIGGSREIPVTNSLKDEYFSLAKENLNYLSDRKGKGSVFI